MPIYLFADSYSSTCTGDWSPLANDDISTITIYVPQGALYTYKGTKIWEDFTHYVEMNATGIGHITTAHADGHSRCYDISGRPDGSGQHGITIVRRPDGSTVKVLGKRNSLAPTTGTRP